MPCLVSTLRKLEVFFKDQRSRGNGHSSRLGADHRTFWLPDPHSGARQEDPVVTVWAVASEPRTFPTLYLLRSNEEGSCHAPMALQQEGMPGRHFRASRPAEHLRVLPRRGELVGFCAYLRYITDLLLCDGPGGGFL